MKPTLCAASLSEWWTTGLESGSTWIALAVVFAGLGGLVFGWLIGRPSASEREAAAAAGKDPLAEAALVWRHEKLILTERQQKEAQERLGRFASYLAEKPSTPSVGYASRIFALAEKVRESRQVVGTDLSRLKMVVAQLTVLRKQKHIPREDAIRASVEMAEKQIGHVEKSRVVLKDVSENLLLLEEEILEQKEFTPVTQANARKVLNRAKVLVSGMPTGWETSPNETDRQIRDLLLAGKEPEFEPVTSILLIDGGVSSSLVSHGETGLAGSIDLALAEVDLAISAAESRDISENETESDVDETESDVDETESDVDNTSNGDSDLPLPDEPVSSGFQSALGGVAEAGQSWENPFLDLAPDTGFQDPKSFSAAEDQKPEIAGESENADSAGEPKPLKKTAKISGFTDLTRDKKAPQEGAISDPEDDSPESESLLIFRSNDVGIWGKDIYRGANHRARSLDSLPDWAEWISMKRLDTGERVFVSIDGDGFSDPDESSSIGFNASNELFYGARHLGVFSEECPNEVETRFTYGGWGFGHRVSSGPGSAESLQAVGWEGKEIPSDTVFEICLHGKLPEPGEGDRVLNPA